MPIPEKPISMRDDWEYVAIAPWRLSAKTRLVPGDAVPKGIRKHVILWGYKRNFIGPKGCEWTDYMLRAKGFNITAKPKSKRKVKANADTDSKPSEGGGVSPLPGVLE